MPPTDAMQRAVQEHLRIKRIHTSMQARFSPKDTAKLKLELELALGKNNFDLYWQQLSSFLTGKIARSDLTSALSPLLGLQFGKTCHTCAIHMATHRTLILQVHFINSTICSYCQFITTPDLRGWVSQKKLHPQPSLAQRGNIIW
jgi:hypothetical protein